MNKYYKLLILGVFAAIFTVSCGKITKISAPLQVSDNLPAVDAKAYRVLLAKDPVALARKAAAGDLGNCLGEYKKSPACTSGYSFLLKLKNINQYFTLIEQGTAAVPTPACDENIGATIKEALLTGVCYRVDDLPVEEIAEMRDETLVRRAYYGTLKYCRLEKLEMNQCPTGGTYGLLLVNRKRYYPYMTTSPEPIGCYASVAVKLREALSEGYCF